MSLYLGLLALFLSISYIAECIPYDGLQENFRKSGETLHKEGYAKKAIPGFIFSRLDNFTDAWMILQCYPDVTVGRIDNIFKSTNYYADVEGEQRIETVRKVGKGDFSNCRVESYGRYWHGYKLTLKTSLNILSYSGIRLLNFVVMGFLCVLSVGMVYRRLPNICGHAFVTILFVGLIWVVPFSLQYSSCFYILFISLIVLLKYPKLIGSEGNGFLSFFTIGAFTSYLDLLTTPLITFCIPATLLLYRQSNPIRKTIIWGAGWALGYGLLWISKWLVSPIFTDVSLWEDAITEVAYRMAGSVTYANLPIVFDSYFIAAVLAVVIFIGYLWGVRYAKIAKDVSKSRQADYLLLISGIVVIWLIVLHNHSTIHCWMIWRILLIPLLAGILYIKKIKDEDRSYNTMLQ